MSKPKYLKLLAVVEEDYEPITGKITAEAGIWYCENVMSIKLKDNFVLPETDASVSVDAFIESVLDLARSRVDE